MSVNVNKMRLRARTLHRLANSLPGLTENVRGLTHHTAMMLQAAAQKIEHLESKLASQSSANQAQLFRAWEEGHSHCFHVENPSNKERNPYAPERASKYGTYGPSPDGYY